MDCGKVYILPRLCIWRWKYMEELSKAEKMVLLRISEELAAEGQQTFVELETLDRKEISEAFEKLEKEEMIRLVEITEGIRVWKTTHKGEDYIQQHKAELESLIKKFSPGLGVDWAPP